MEQLESHYFYKLLKLRKKEVRYEHHHDFLAVYRKDVIPDGLKIQNTNEKIINITFPRILETPVTPVFPSPQKPTFDFI